MPKMKAAVFVEPGRILLDEKPIPEVGPLDALIRVTTTICGTDVHILFHAGYFKYSGYALVNSTECSQTSSSVGSENADDT